jgi:hypothetical protein
MGHQKMDRVGINKTVIKRGKNPPIVLIGLNHPSWEYYSLFILEQSSKGFSV